MQIALAYAWEGYLPDEIVEVEARLGRRMIHEGRARAVAEEIPPLEQVGPGDPPALVGLDELIAELKQLRVHELRQYAADHGITLDPSLRARLPIVAAITGAITTRASEAMTAGSGDNPEEATDVR